MPLAKPLFILRICSRGDNESSSSLRAGALPSDPPSIRYPGQPALSLRSPFCPRPFSYILLPRRSYSLSPSGCSLPSPRQEMAAAAAAARVSRAACEMPEQSVRRMSFFPLLFESFISGAVANKPACLCHRRWIKERKLNSPSCREGKDRRRLSLLTSAPNVRLGENAQATARPPE